jgi:eukaryotic-like serine/threonine-protein kinase
LCELPQPVGFGAWSTDGVILVGGSGAGSLWRVPAGGGAPVQVTKIDLARQENFHSQASFLPDARHFVYLRSSVVAESSGIYVGSLDAKPEDQAARRLMVTTFGARFVATAGPRSGYLLFFREGTLSAQRFDTVRLELVGEPVPVRPAGGQRE